MDPDLHLNLDTSAPTVARQSVMLLLQILASNLERGWEAGAGDITAAFLNGDELTRELYIRQAKTGLGGLHPEQLVRLRKWVFGLVDSPAAWWRRLKGTLLGMRVELSDGKCGRMTQCPLDPCVFQLQYEDIDEVNPPIAYLAVHVDDLLLIGESRLCQRLREELSRLFPVDEWELQRFEYIGSFIEVKDSGVKVSQTSYAETRLFEVEILAGQRDDEMASEEQRSDNRSLVRALSWLAGQSRPDLQTGVSMAQQLQKMPTVGDIKFSNQLSKRASQMKGEGVWLRPIDLNRAVLLAYHDAAWSNAPQDPDDPHYVLDGAEDEQGMITVGPFAEKDRKAKRGNSRVASQIGSLYLLADRGILEGETSKTSIIDWRSSACSRVCRSTFAATMACAAAIENSDYIRRFLETLLTGKLERGTASRVTVRFMSDCKSLYDHLKKEGIPKVPADRRLAIDLAAIRDDLRHFGRIAWIPNTYQLADIMTKPLKPDIWWRQVGGDLRLPFKEGGNILDQCKSGSTEIPSF